MFVAPNVYSRSVDYIDLDDRDFFEQSVRLAANNINPDFDKLQSPVLFVSRLSKQSQAESVSAPRRLMYNADRIRRKFLMLDVDFEGDQWDESNQLRENCKSFAEKFKTPLLIYPTLSWPLKPRYRIVYVTKRLMTPVAYYKGIKWLSEQLDYQLTDASDTRINANRNMPVFSNDDQVENVYSSLADTSLEPLDNKMWSNVQGPGYSKSEFVQRDTSLALAYKHEDAVSAMSWYIDTHDTSSYENTWFVIESVCKAVYEKLMQPATAVELMKMLAGSTDDYVKTVEWSRGNMEMFNRYTEQFKSGSRRLTDVRDFVMLCRKAPGFVASVLANNASK